MSISKKCITHNLPDDVCGPCNAAQEERERIIALLDEAFIYEEPVVIQRDRLIALIKGNNE